MMKLNRWFISDRAITRPEQDEFGHVDVAAQLADIVQTVEGPATIGLIGGFGTGKSSIGNLLEWRLASHDQFQVVTLSGERHTGIARQRALVYSFAEALQEDAGVGRAKIERILGKIEASEDLEQPDLTSVPLVSFLSEQRGTMLRAVWRTLLVATFVYLAGVALAAIVNIFREQDLNILTAPLNVGYLAILLFVTLGTLLVRVFEPWIRASLSPRHRTSRRPRAEAADELERVFGDLAALCPKKLVVVVDDIDRLPPEEVLEALATIKSLQAVPKKYPPIFIIACDDEIVRRAIQVADPGLSSIDGSQQKAAEAYLNKLFLVRQPLPPPLREDMTGFARKVLQAPQTNHAGQAALGDSLTGVLEVLIHQGVVDPRHVVRLLNAFFADYRLATVREKGAGRLAARSVTGAPLTLARLTVLRVDFANAYAAVRDEYDLLEALDAHVLGQNLDKSQEALITQARLRPPARLPETPSGVRDDDEESDDELRAPAVKTDGSPQELPAELADFLRRTARYVEQNVPLGPFFYLSETGAGRILGSKRAEQIRVALENNDVETVRSRLTDDESIADAAVDHIKATLGLSRIGLPLTNAIATASSCLVDAPDTRRSDLAAEIATIISREPQVAPEPAALADLIRHAPETYRAGLIEKAADFAADEDAVTPRAMILGELAVEFPRERRLTAALAGYFVELPSHSGHAEAREWIALVGLLDIDDRNRIYGPEFYSAVIRSTVGAPDDAIPVEDADAFGELLQAAPQAVSSSTSVLEGVLSCFAADGVEPRWFAMRALEHLVILAPSVQKVLAEVSKVCVSTEVSPYRQTLKSAMKVIASLSVDHSVVLKEMASAEVAEVVAAVTTTGSQEDVPTQIEAARALESLGQLWPDDIAPAVDALVSVLDSRRSTEDKAGQAIQAALLSVLDVLPPDVGERAAEALLSPIATATDQNAPSVRMAIEAIPEACRSDQGRSLVASRVGAWRQVFQASIAKPAQVRPQAEALRVAALHNAFTVAEQQELLARLNALVTQSHPLVDAAAETLSTIPWGGSLRSGAGAALSSAWDEVDDEVRQRVLDDLSLWPHRDASPDADLLDKVTQFLVEDDKGSPEHLTSLWPWLSIKNRASILASDVDRSFRRSKLQDAETDERYATLLAATHASSFSEIFEDFHSAAGDRTSAAAVQFIEEAITDEHVGWDDAYVRLATKLVSEDDAETLAREGMKAMNEGATRAGRAASLVAWLRLRHSAGLAHLNDDLREAIMRLLPSADEDLAGRLGHVSTPMPDRTFRTALRTLRTDQDNQRSRSAADAFLAGRTMKS
ncbi:P-loop NTPase fold protein [Ornithinimicrobium cryptoxanthini]|uniref:P-loop NTPase fold protein n=1 Tax=Ornithinimicrobium cryptoxanthini TaxID=2934161 RepID=UPI00211925B9|nr:P-loop NTPase fold protein [Ornithinimicrobium cryptoxanthini]